MSNGLAIFCLLLLGVQLGYPEVGKTQDRIAPSALLQPLSEESLPNAQRLNERLISGGQPEGESAFARLRELGVKTIISVDGATPAVAAAEKFGLRYVHLPHGYDGIPPARAAELAKAVRDLPGPIYIHCHHGKHRSPAAAATACRALGWLDAEQAVAFLEQAGTSPHYLGLFEAVRATETLESAALDQLSIEFRSTEPLPEVAEAMVALERHFERLTQLAANDWEVLPKHPDLKPAHEALLLREQYRERLSAGEKLAYQLEELLRQPKKQAQPELALQETLRALQANCQDCHRQYRDQGKPRNKRGD